MHEAWALPIVIVLFYMIPTPHNVLDLAQEISRTERDGKDYVTMVLYNSNNLRTGEPELKAVVTSTDCRRFAYVKCILVRPSTSAKQDPQFC